MEDKKDVKKDLIDLLKKKSKLKQDIYKNTTEWFRIFKEELKDSIDMIRKEVDDERIRLRYVDRGTGEAQLFIGSDVLIYNMHTNIFKFSSRDFASKTSYVQNTPENAFCGVINIYNFLADSYEFNRPNDLGYLIGRIFINRENHFVVEGKGQLGFLYRDFMHQVLDKEAIRDLILHSAIHAIEFDLLSPPYDSVDQVTVHELQTLQHSSQLKTGKRLGFKFKSNNDFS